MLFQKKKRKKEAECPRYQINLQRNFNPRITNLLTNKNEKL